MPNIRFDLKELDGSGLKADKFLKRIDNDTEVPLPEVGEIELEIPPFFMQKSKNGWKLVNPLTEVRNLATRKKNPSVSITRKNVEDPSVKEYGNEKLPTLSDFSVADRNRIINYFQQVKRGEYTHYTTKNKPRGFPATLYKNARKQGLKEDPKTKTYAPNKIQSKAPRKTTPKAQQSPTPAKSPEPKEVPIIPIYEGEEEEVEDTPQNRGLKKYLEELKDPKISKQRLKEIKSTLSFMKNAENIDNRKLYNKVKDAYNTAIERNPKLGKGLKESDTDSNSDSDNEGGALWYSVKSFVKPIVKRETDKIHAITHPVETYSKTSDFGSKLIHGRKDYPPSAKAIIDKYANNTVEHVELHRKPLPSLYTNIMNVWTKGETNKRLAEQPKDTLFHISMWVRVSGGTTILVEKNEVIHLQVNPKLAKEEEIQVAPSPPAGLKFKDMFDKTLAKVGPENMFSYSARDNNCGNFIEYILNANGMSSQATNDFIGQDTKTIMKGFPILNKTLNNLTDTAGRANVLIEGGGVMDDLRRLMRQIMGQNARIEPRPSTPEAYPIATSIATTPAPPSRNVSNYIDFANLPRYSELGTPRIRSVPETYYEHTPRSTVSEPNNIDTDTIQYDSDIDLIRRQMSGRGYVLLRRK